MQSDSTSQAVKNLDIVLGAEQAVLVLDDTTAVWPAHQPNLITVHLLCSFSPSFLRDAPRVFPCWKVWSRLAVWEA